MIISFICNDPLDIFHFGYFRTVKVHLGRKESGYDFGNNAETLTLSDNSISVLFLC